MKKVFFCFSFLLIGGSLLLAGDLGAQTVRGVTDTEILVGQTGPQTGPAALWVFLPMLVSSQLGGAVLVRVLES